MSLTAACRTFVALGLLLTACAPPAQQDALQAAADRCAMGHDPYACQVGPAYRETEPADPTQQDKTVIAAAVTLPLALAALVAVRGKGTWWGWNRQWGWGWWGGGW